MNMRPASPLLCAMVCASISACGMRGLPAEVTGAYERSFNKDDLDATVALFADDAQILQQYGPVVSGREGIREFLQNQMTPVVSFDTNTEMTLVRSDIAIEQGNYKVRDVRRGSDIEMGKYLHVWKRANGDWKLYRIIYNVDVASDAEVSVATAQEESNGG